MSALSVLWGGAFFFAKIALAELPPLTTAAGRVAIAALLLVSFVRLRGQSLAACLPIWPAIVVLALFNNAVPFGLIFWGQTHIASGLASILNATTPLFTVLIAHLATTDEKITPISACWRVPARPTRSW